MNILSIINSVLQHGSEARPLLDGFLSNIATRFPDAAPEIQEYLAKLDAAAPPEAEGLVSELKNFVATRKLDPRQHPSDLAG